jgi:DNA ligase-1
LAEAPDEDKLWLLALFSGKRPPRQVSTTQLRQWAAEAAGIPDWLFEESYHITGDLAETLSLILPAPTRTHNQTLSSWIGFLQSLGELDEESKKANLMEAFEQLSAQERFVFIKLMTGGFRIGISQQLITRAVAEVYQLDKAEVAHRLMGNWEPQQTTFHELIIGKETALLLSKPYPFCLAQCVLDGELMAWQDDAPLPFAELQKRIGRKMLSKKMLAEVPVVFIAYDLLEYEGADYRNRPLAERRQLLEQIVAQTAYANLRISPTVGFQSWEELAAIRQTAREYAAEGLMLKKLASPYQTGRVRGHWWKWKVQPLSIDGVLMYAQKGHGKRATLYTDYTFGVWDGDKLVTFAKAYSGLTDKEIAQVDAFVKKNTLEKFGPVRTVKPELVFEIGFEGIQASSRHKSGVALRFPRILRWRTDKKPQDANTLADLRALADAYK